MSLSKLYLRADNEENMLAALKSAGLTYTDDDNVDHIKTTNVAVIGTMYQPTGNMLTETGPDGETFEVPEMEAVPGWHVNVITGDEAVVSALAEVTISPNSPSYVWAYTV